jgi:protein associated with RNAse G/E
VNASGARPRTVRVQKRDWRGRARYTWEGTVLSQDASCLVILAPWTGPGEPVVGDLQFVRGDRFVEYYYAGMGLAIWQVERSNGEIKGWYCNISRPIQMDGNTISFDDLLLDVVVHADGRYAVLDRDELEQARRDGLPESDANAAEATLQTVLDLIVRQQPPFTFSGPPRAIADEP